MKYFIHIICLLTAILSSHTNASIISVDLGFAGSPMLFNGVESQAAALDPAFANSSVWNGLGLSADWDRPPSTNSTFSNLSNSNGDSTAVNFSVLGNINSFNYSNFYNRPEPGPLHGDYWFFNSRDASTSLDWHLSGLIPGAEYRMVFYGAYHDQNRVFDMIIDTNGNGDLNDEALHPVDSLAGAFPVPTYLTSVFASTNGDIYGRAAGSGPNTDYAYEANWSGFQIAAVVPLPTAFWLFGSGLFGLFWIAKRKSRT